jgi:hypothetical protein
VLNSESKFDNLKNELQPLLEKVNQSKIMIEHL